MIIAHGGYAKLLGLAHEETVDAAKEVDRLYKKKKKQENARPSMLRAFLSA